MVDSELDLVFNLQCLQKRSARKRFRKSILDEWPECAYCGRKHPTTLDHVIPRAKGGKQDRRNLIGACGACNLEKSDLDWFVWYRGQVFWTPEREHFCFQRLLKPQQVRSLEGRVPSFFRLISICDVGSLVLQTRDPSLLFRWPLASVHKSFASRKDCSR